MVLQIVVAFLIVFMASRAVAGPINLPYSGRFVEDDAKPVDGPVDVLVEFFKDETAGESVSGPHVFPGVLLQDGVFQLNIALEASEFHKIFKSVDRPAWIQITDATHGVVYPRQLLAATPYALKVPVDNSTIGWNNDGQLTVLDGATLTEKNGNLGIGAANPATKIEIESTSAATGATDGMLIDQHGAGDSAISFKTPAEQYVVGIDQSDANKFKISDGSDFGADRFVIDSSGKVGIGTTSPTSSLHIHTPAAIGVAPSLLLTTDHPNAGPSVWFRRDSSSSPKWAGMGLNDSDNSFRISTTGTFANAAVTILPNGNVGIGTTTPASIVDIKTATFSSLGLRTNASGGAVGDGFELQMDNSNDAYIWNKEAGRMFFGTSGAAAVSILADGKVGIGTAIPGYKLDVTGNTSFASASSQLRIKETDNADPSDAWHFSMNTGALRFHWEDNSAGPTYYERFTLLENGNVGIGTAAPSKALDVNSDSIRVRTAKTPASSTAACDQGEIAWDANYIYVCRATNTWVRSALSTW